jgi:hypothetical protein
VRRALLQATVAALAGALLIALKAALH